MMVQMEVGRRGLLGGALVRLLHLSRISPSRETLARLGAALARRL